MSFELLPHSGVATACHYNLLRPGKVFMQDTLPDATRTDLNYLTLIIDLERMQKIHFEYASHFIFLIMIIFLRFLQLTIISLLF